MLRDNEGKVWKEGEKIKPAGRRKRLRGEEENRREQDRREDERQNLGRRRRSRKNEKGKRRATEEKIWKLFGMLLV